jgi:hypothetical protein
MSVCRSEFYERRACIVQRKVSHQGAVAPVLSLHSKYTCTHESSGGCVGVAWEFLQMGSQVQCTRHSIPTQSFRLKFAHNFMGGAMYVGAGNLHVAMSWILNLAYGLSAWRQTLLVYGPKLHNYLEINKLGIFWWRFTEDFEKQPQNIRKNTTNSIKWLKMLSIFWKCAGQNLERKPTSEKFGKILRIILVLPSVNLKNLPLCTVY